MSDNTFEADTKLQAAVWSALDAGLSADDIRESVENAITEATNE